MTRILVVDDEPQLLRALRINLRARHYDVAVAATGTAALSQAGTWHPDLVLLDLGLPDLEGVEVIHGLRGWTQVPIIVLSGRAGSKDKVEALDAGADDYVTKPFGIEELIARIKAVSRRVRPRDEAPVVQFGEHTVDLVAKTVTRASGSQVRLTPTEWDMLEILVRNPGRLVGQRRLLAEVWGSDHVRETNYLRQYLAQLRRKLEPDPAHPRHLITEPGMGYRFQP